jgi:hypothetical protein
VPAGSFSGTVVAVYRNLEERRAMVKKSWVVAISFSALILGLLGGMVVWRPDGKSEQFRLEAAALEEKQKTIAALEERIASLRKELEDGANHIAKLQTRLKDAGGGIHAAEQELKGRHPDGPTDTGRLSRRGGLTTNSGQPTNPVVYETSRTTSVYEKPSVSSMKLATIPEGTRVNVVGFTGEWLEIRSKHGKPPGFIQQADTRFVKH